MRELVCCQLNFFLLSSALCIIQWLRLHPLPFHINTRAQFFDSFISWLFITLLLWYLIPSWRRKYSEGSEWGVEGNEQKNAVWKKRGDKKTKEAKEERKLGDWKTFPFFCSSNQFGLILTPVLQSSRPSVRLIINIGGEGNREKERRGGGITFRTQSRNQKREGIA